MNLYERFENFYAKFLTTYKNVRQMYAFLGQHRMLIADLPNIDMKMTKL